MRRFTYQLSKSPELIVAEIEVFPNREIACKARDIIWDAVVISGGSAFIRDIPILDTDDGGALPYSFDFSGSKVPFISCEVWKIEHANAPSCSDFLVKRVFDPHVINWKTSPVDLGKFCSAMCALYEQCPYAFSQVCAGLFIIRPVPGMSVFGRKFIETVMSLNETFFEQTIEIQSISMIFLIS
jgi:hypothetical protein